MAVVLEARLVAPWVDAELWVDVELWVDALSTTPVVGMNPAQTPLVQTSFKVVLSPSSQAVASALAGFVQVPGLVHVPASWH